MPRLFIFTSDWKFADCNVSRRSQAWNLWLSVPIQTPRILNHCSGRFMSFTPTSLSSNILALESGSPTINLFYRYLQESLLFHWHANSGGKIRRRDETLDWTLRKISSSNLIN
jgi:hypothetical protein